MSYVFVFLFWLVLLGLGLLETDLNSVSHRFLVGMGLVFIRFGWLETETKGVS